MYLIFRTSEIFKLCIVNGIERLTIGAKRQTRSPGFGFGPFNNPNAISNNVFQRGNLQIEPAWKYGGMARYLTTTNIPDKPVNTGQVDKVDEDLADMKNKLKKVQSDAEGITAEINVLMDEWKREGYPDTFSKQKALDSLKEQQAKLQESQATLTTREATLISERNQLEAKLKDAGTFTPSKVTFTPPSLLRKVPYIRPSVFNEVVDAIDALSTSYAEPSCTRGVPVIYGHPGTGKTRLAEEASREWFDKDIAEKNSNRTTTSEPESLANYQYGYVNVSELSKFVSRDVEPEAAVGYAMLHAMGQNVLTKGPHMSHYDAAVDLLQTNEVNTFVLNLDEFQTDRNFVRKVVRGCMKLGRARIIPILSGLTHPDGDKFESGSGSWATYPIHLTPFDDTAELEKNFVKAIDLSWEDYVNLPASRFLFAACGGFPRQIMILAAESMEVLEQPNIGELSNSVLWKKSSNDIFKNTLHRVKGYYDESRWHKSLTDPTYSSDHTLYEIQPLVPSIETDTMPDVIRIGVTAVLGAEVKKSDLLGKDSDRKWSSLFDVGTVSYSRGSDDEHAKPRISYFVALAMCDLADGNILPPDPELYEPMRQDFRALEAVAGASLFVRLRYEQIKGNAGTYIPLSSLRPGCHVIKDPNIDIEIQVPEEDELQWVIGAHTSELGKELKDFNVGEIARTAIQTEALDAFARLRGNLKTRDRGDKIVASQPVVVEVFVQAKPSPKPSILAFGDITNIVTGMRKIVYEVPMLSQEELDKMEPGQKKQLEDREGKRTAWPLERTLPNETQPLKVVRVVDIVSDKMAEANLFKKNSDVYKIPKLMPGCVALMVTTRAEYEQVLGDVLGTRTMIMKWDKTKFKEGKVKKRC